MRRQSPRLKDLSVAEFKQQLKANGFSHLRNENVFADVRERRGLSDDAARRSEIYPRLAPVMAGRHRIHRRATLHALLQDRARRVSEAEAEAARLVERQRIAASIAPVALSPPRAELREEQAIAVMADDFVTIEAANGAVTFPDLLRLGWSKVQVFEYVDLARALGYSRQMGNAA